MAESPTHERLKRQLAGPRGQTEVTTPAGSRVDAVKGNVAIQVLMEATPENIRRALKGINDSQMGSGLISARNQDIPVIAEEAKRLARKPITIINRQGQRKARTTPKRKP